VRALFDSQPPWFLAGPLLGACVVAMALVANTRLGVVGGFSDLVETATRRSVRIGTRGSFLLGVAGGGLVFAVVSGGRLLDGYGWVTRAFPEPAALAILVGAGVLIGYGAKLAGGCTSGNGLCGNAAGSPASAVATATFFATAVVVSVVTNALFGGSA